MTGSELWRRTRARLAGAALADPAGEARWMLEAATGRELSGVLADRGPVADRAVALVGEMVARRREGEPLQYVLGAWSFCGIDLFVDPRVLIPRPETEVTAQVAVAEAVGLGLARGRPDPWRDPGDDVVVDLGTGSGALALALASQLPDARVWATDVSPDALAVARSNLAGAGAVATRVRLAQGDWYDALPTELAGRVRMVVSNPPYVAEAEVADLAPEVVDHEPWLALVSGTTGLEAIARVLDGAPRWLAPGGAVVCEIGAGQGAAAAARAAAAGLVDVRVERDLVGRDRVVVGRVA